jgi:acetoacetyl-CoA synthetase
MNKPLWTPDPERIRQSNMRAFMEAVEGDWDVSVPDYAALRQWSVTEREQFWQSVRNFRGVRAQTWGDDVLVNGDAMPGARWFPDARLNFAENLLQRRDDAEAMVFWGENQVKRRMTYRELYDLVSQLAQVLRAAGVAPGDRVTGFMPNMPETIAAMLATTSIGAIWSSCSPDFGVRGVVDRFGQIEPKVLFTADGYRYNGKSHDSLGRVAEFLEELPTVDKVIVIPYIHERASLESLAKASRLEDEISRYAPGEIEFAQLPFDHPLYVMFSSGTTGVPKCIVHGAGGTLLQHLKEQQLHCDIRPETGCFTSPPAVG